MVTFQQKKQCSAASDGGCNSGKQYRAKKKNLISFHHHLNMGSHISLVWDDNCKRVVSKKEQISMTWRDLTPFVDYIHRCQTVLANVCSIPLELFELDNLTEVLSFEAWQTHLSEKEKNFLMQFLPEGPDAEQIVQALLGGDNFHFGNPLFKWGTSLCSGKLHPDVVLHRERYLKASKKVYYTELEKYHNGLVHKLQKWKERWASCKDPEKEIVQKIWRSGMDVDKNISSYENESRFLNPEDNLAVTPESYSWDAEENACCSDNQNSSSVKAEMIEDRKNLMNVKCRNLLVPSDGLKLVARPRKGERLHKHNIRCSDGAKYMSYFKISRKQHQLIKNMKLSGNCIQFGVLNHVLGDLGRFHVQPYAVFEAEEQKRLHEHWLQLANRDLLAAFTNWRLGQVQKKQRMKSLEQEIQEKLKTLTEAEEIQNSDSMQLKLKDFEAGNYEPGNEDDGECVCYPDKEESLHAPILTKSLQEISPYNDKHKFNYIVVGLEGNQLPQEPVNLPSDISEFSENFNPSDVAVVSQEGVPSSCVGDLWPATSDPQTYYHSTSSQGYISASQFSIGHSQSMVESCVHMIDLESGMTEEEIGDGRLHPESTGRNLGSYPNQYRNELLQSVWKGQEILAYLHRHRQSKLEFQPTPNGIMESNNFSAHFRDQLQPSLPLEQMHCRQNEFFIHQNIQDNMFSDAGRYFSPRQQQLSSVNVQDWVVNAVGMSSPLQSQSAAELLSPNLFCSEHKIQGDMCGSHGSGIPSLGIGHGSNADGSLFSVLSQCRELSSSTPYDSRGSMEQLIPPRNYGLVGGTILRNCNNLQHSSNQLDYLGGREATSAMMSNNLGWMSLQHQNSAIQDSMGKPPFLRTWNQ